MSPSFEKHGMNATFFLCFSRPLPHHRDRVAAFHLPEAEDEPFTDRLRHLLLFDEFPSE